MGEENNFGGHLPPPPPGAATVSDIFTHYCLNEAVQTKRFETDLRCELFYTIHALSFDFYFHHFFESLYFSLGSGSGS